MKDLTITYTIEKCIKELYHCEEGIDRFTDSLMEVIINSGFSISQVLHLLESKLGYETY